MYIDAIRANKLVKFIHDKDKMHNFVFDDYRG